MEDMYPINYDNFVSDTKMEMKTTNRSEIGFKTGQKPYDEACEINRNNLICGY